MKEAKRKVLPMKNLTDAELQDIWDRNKITMRKQTPTALVQMQRPPQRLPAAPVSRRREPMPGILNTPVKPTPPLR